MEGNYYYYFIIVHPRYDRDSLYVSSKVWGRGFANIELSFYVSIRRLEDYVKDIKEKTNFRKTKITRTTIIRKLKLEEKQLFGYFKRDLSREDLGMATKGKD